MRRNQFLNHIIAEQQPVKRNRRHGRHSEDEYLSGGGSDSYEPTESEIEQDSCSSYEGSEDEYSSGEEEYDENESWAKKFTSPSSKRSASKKGKKKGRTATSTEYSNVTKKEKKAASSSTTAAKKKGKATITETREKSKNSTNSPPAKRTSQATKRKREKVTNAATSTLNCHEHNIRSSSAKPPIKKMKKVDVFYDYDEKEGEEVEEEEEKKEKDIVNEVKADEKKKGEEKEEKKKFVASQFTFVPPDDMGKHQVIEKFCTDQFHVGGQTFYMQVATTIRHKQDGTTFPLKQLVLTRVSKSGSAFNFFVDCRDIEPMYEILGKILRKG